MIEDGHRPEAIFGANDITAIGALDALREKIFLYQRKQLLLGSII